MNHPRRSDAFAKAAQGCGFERTEKFFGFTMAQAGKTRIYDLAKELKLDNKKVIEDARREGIDVSVPSNTVPNEVAERIRTKYFPKKIVPHHGPRLVKHAKTEPLTALAAMDT